MKKLAVSLTILLTATMGSYALADGDEPEPAAAQAAGGVDQYGLPLGAGHDLTMEKCTMCHSAYEFSSLRRTSDEWRGTISDMIGKGAAISEAEFPQIHAYLTTNLGPAGAKPAAPAATPAP